jgi:O-antigen ligase
MTKGLQRSNGFYHDMVTSRINIMQGLLGLVYLKVTNILNVKPWVIWALLLIFVFSGYTLFSKALIGICLVGLILLITTLKQETKNYAIGFFIFIAFLVTNFETVVNSTSTLFLSELEYQDGNLDNSGQLFSGRGSVWEEYLAMYSSLSTIEKTFGMGINSGNTHNEFLRVLMLTGILGLIGYTLFVFRIIYLAITNFHRKKVLLLTTFSLSMLIIDILGVVWGLYPFYLVIILGFFSVAINYESDSEEEFELDEDLEEDYEESYDGEYEVAN